MNQVYVVTHVTKGPAGHGEPGMESISLRDDGEWGLGDLAPAFSEKILADTYIKNHKLGSNYKAIPLEVI